MFNPRLILQLGNETIEQNQDYGDFIGLSGITKNNKQSR
jgi:hypothetical protein